MSFNPKVGVVVVNWNKKDDVLNLLESLKGIEYDNRGIIVVDNASTDGSAEEIRRQFPYVHLIVNPENLGGTGGFNTGIRYTLEKGGFKYIWLLDNDARVEDNTLDELIKVMEEDKTIGIAGSRILDTERKDITVEAGAFLRRDTVDVKPLFRNVKDLNTQAQIEDVDYVAICSALVRVSALDEVGLMDERYFIFWDDMDWGLQFKENGYRVVAVLNSIAYHPAFTEKRSPLIDFYYGNRNALLTYAKHTNPLERIPIFFNYLRTRLKGFIFLGMSGRRDLMFMGAKGIYDFITGTWGRKVLDNLPEEIQNTRCDFPKEVKNVIILNGGSRNEIFSVLDKLRQSFPRADFTLLMADDRFDIYNDDFQRIIKLNSKKQHIITYNLVVFFKMLLNGYDVAVNPKYPSPFSFAVKRVYDFNPSTGEFIESKNNMKGIWKLIISIILGEVIGVLLLPVVYVCSLKYERSR